MNLDTAAKTINKQQDLKVAELEEIICSDYEKNNKTWSDYPTSPYTTSFAEALIRSPVNRASLYNVRRVSNRKFQVHFIGAINSECGELYEMEKTGDDTFKNVPIPLYSRVRDVFIEANGTMFCSCCHFESCGMFCSHQVAVANMVHAENGVEFSGFTHHDIVARYLSGYMHMAYDPATPMDIQKTYHQLASNDISGPSLAIEIGSQIHIVNEHVHLAAVERVKNYDVSHLKLDKFDGCHTQTYTPSAGDENEDIMQEKMFAEERDYFYGMTEESTELIFDESINNSDLPKSMSAGISTRDKLKQPWEEACALADNIGVEAATELEMTLKRFSAFCNEKNHTVTNDGDDCDGVIVPATGARYKGTRRRIFNTHHMPASSNFKG